MRIVIKIDGVEYAILPFQGLWELYGTKEGPVGEEWYRIAPNTSFGNQTEALLWLVEHELNWPNGG